MSQVIADASSHILGSSRRSIWTWTSNVSVLSNESDIFSSDIFFWYLLLIYFFLISSSDIFFLISGKVKVKYSFIHSFIHSFITSIYKAPLQVGLLRGDEKKRGQDRTVWETKGGRDPREPMNHTEGVLGEKWSQPEEQGAREAKWYI